MSEKNTLNPGKAKHVKMGQLLVAKDTKLDQATHKFPFDFIFYNYYRIEDGFIVYQEMYSENHEKKLNKMMIPDTMIDDFMTFIAEEQLLND